MYSTLSYRSPASVRQFSCVFVNIISITAILTIYKCNLYEISLLKYHSVPVNLSFPGSDGQSIPHEMSLYPSVNEPLQLSFNLSCLDSHSVLSSMSVYPSLNYSPFCLKRQSTARPAILFPRNTSRSFSK